jgi:hypothetical protein
MDDLSQRAILLVIEYCLGISDESAKKIRGKVIPSSKTQSRRRWPIGSPLVKRRDFGD